MTVFFAALVVIGIVLLAVTAIRVIGGGIAAPPPSGAPEVSPARRLLDERYARSELTTEEYRDLVRQLERSD